METSPDNAGTGQPEPESGSPSTHTAAFLSLSLSQNLANTTQHEFLEDTLKNFEFPENTQFPESFDATDPRQVRLYKKILLLRDDELKELVSEYPAHVARLTDKLASLKKEVEERESAAEKNKSFEEKLNELKSAFENESFVERRRRVTELSDSLAAPLIRSNPSLAPTIRKIEAIRDGKSDQEQQK